MLITSFFIAGQAGNLSGFTLLHKLSPSDNQTNYFSFYAISDLLPLGIIFQQWRRGVSFFESTGYLGLAESVWGNRIRPRKQKRKVKVKQRENREETLYFFYFYQVFVWVRKFF